MNEVSLLKHTAQKTHYPPLTSGHQYLWLAGGYDLQIGHFEKWLAAFLHGDNYSGSYIFTTQGHIKFPFVWSEEKVWSNKPRMASAFF